MSTLIDDDIDVANAVIFEESPFTCENGDCKNPADYKIYCAHRDAIEFRCTPCIEETWVNEDLDSRLFVFAKTCQHVITARFVFLIKI